MAKEEKSNAGTTQKKETAEPEFLGSQLTDAATGVNHDVMSVVLSPDAQYTEAKARNLIKKFLIKEVTHNGGRKLGNSK